MKIISPFHDYYDTALGLGHDPSLVYRRQVAVKNVHVEDLDQRIGDLFSRGTYGWGFEATVALIGFCGRLYPVYLAPWFTISVESVSEKPPRNPVLTRQELDEYYDRLSGGVRLTKWNRSYRSGLWDVLDLQGTPAAPETFRLLDAPLWIAHRAEWRGLRTRAIRVYTNIRLANLEFQKHFDPYTAIQEIEMFLGSILTKADDSVRTVGSDEILAGQKGFGPESFRNSAPSARKTRRRENRVRKKADG